MHSHEILRITDLYKTYGLAPVLNGVELSLNYGERLALVGENGTGKTTLARLICGDDTPDSGTLRVAEGAQVGYLPQEVTAPPDVTVQAYVERMTGDLDRLRQRLRELEQQMTQPLSDNAMQRVLDEYGSVQEQFERRGGYDIEARTEAVFAGLGIDYLASERLLATLSGGERTRVALAALLLQAPDLLLLDEPTNHLDFAGIHWLEEYLAQVEYAVLLITHDRAFINRVATVIAELHPMQRQLHIYHGNYDDYLAERERRYQQAVDAYNTQQNEAKALQRLIKQTHHNRKTNGAFTDIGDKFLRDFKRGRLEVSAGKEIRDARQRLAELEADKLANPRHEWRIEYRFDPLPLPSDEPLRLRGICKGYGATQLFDAADATVHSGERVVLVAPNGAGKSTLLRMIAGLEIPDAGSIALTQSTQFALLDQDGETLDSAQTVLQCFREVTHGSDSELLAQLHRAGLFSNAELGRKRVRELSVGQRRKLGIARLIASRANLLLLDEPTNHLDPMSLEALEDALLTFEGAILAVSHDRRFVEKVATRVWQLADGQLVSTAPETIAE